MGYEGGTEIASHPEADVWLYVTPPTSFKHGVGL